MQVNLQTHKCAWCGHDAAFLCLACMKYTCRDCYQGQDEAGCFHEKKVTLESKGWSAGLQLEFRLMDA